MFQVLFAPIIRSSKNRMCNHWYKSWNVVVKFRDEVVVGRWYLALLWNLTTTFYDLYQWLHMQFLELLMMGAKSTRNM
jgi:hypothetical protein